ncbi:MAG: hypothetical protein ABS45_10015 [Comamonas sp. SCN 65-56]|uniref:UPF0149 family protein n=1 Tax=Comamonas sp. SCN 65-56 TaxID=1660095 RepID=UPI00086D95B5|nr:UPF0149 family protein [Comamonas sp. SCN 65-56]ODS91702.1 MAG: hypothetical protein ABS45_10015 [Comamonas sp. SCN 65-56]
MLELNEFFAWNMGPARARNLEDCMLGDAAADEYFELMGAGDLPEGAMSAEQADGYLTALVLGPDAPPTHEWLQIIFDQPTLPLAHDTARRDRLLNLLCARYLDIQLRLAVPAEERSVDNIYTPWIAEVPQEDRITPYQLRDDGTRRGDWLGREWAEGFHLAIADDPVWEELIADPEHHGLLAPVLLYQMGYNPDHRELQIDDDGTLPAHLVAYVYAMRQWWRDWRRSERGQSWYAEPLAPLPYERGAPKVGRNDPCPCGSGKKYKKCCGA